MFRSLVAAGLVVSLLAVPPYAFATDKKDIDELSLEDLLKAETSVASEKPMTIRETPGVITIVTRDEIVRSGARDLMDVLLMVPGFYFGVDVEGVYGLGFRGNWGHEGKILLLVDGQEMNELAYTTTQFGNHFSTDLIEKVEIIRGPGSAVYGGAAELAVINITTRIGANYSGVTGGATFGFTPDAFMRRNYHLAAGGSPVEGAYAGASLFLGYAKRSDRDYTDFYGSKVNLEDSYLMPVNLNFKGEYKGFRLRFMTDVYRTESPDAYDAIVTPPEKVDWISYYVDTSYAWKPADTLTVTPLFSFRRSQPWNAPTSSPLMSQYFERTFDRYLGSLKAAWQATDELHLTAGTQLDYLRAENESWYAPTPFHNGKLNITYHNFAAFAQGLFRHEIVNVTAGARYEKHEQYGSSFVPRIALTKVWGRFHLKGLYSRAFRAPAVQNIDLSLGVKPEKTDVFEAEGGVQITDELFFTANFYDITIRKAIVYDYDPVTDTESYPNFPKTGSRGVEAELKWHGKRVSASANYSFYHPGGKNRVPSYQVAGHDDVLLGFPAHKIGVNGSIVPVKNLSVSPSLVFLSPRYGYGVATPGGAQFIRKYNEAWLLNLYARYDNLFLPGISAGAGIMNLLNDNAVLLQPYDGYHAPMPGQSREFIFQLSYDLDAWSRDGAAASDGESGQNL